MTIEQIREAHKTLHGRRKVQKQALVERLEAGWSVEDTINTGNGRDGKYALYGFGKGKTTKQGKTSG